MFKCMGSVLEYEGTEEAKVLADKVRSQQNGVWKDKVYKGLQPMEGDFLTLIHGDAWYKNSLLK